MFLIPMAIGAGLGALTNKKSPLAGAALGAGLGAAGGATGIFGAGTAGAGAATGAASSGAASAAGATGAGAAGTVAAGAPATGIFSPQNLQGMAGIATIANQAGLFGDAQSAPAVSAGIPGRQSADFTGLMNGQGQQMSGAQKLAMQRQARRG
jgi:hypothetical protein